MESNESQSQRTYLPPLKHFDFDKIKREELEYQKRNTTMTPVSTSSSATASPSFRYPTGPPPPYSHPISHPPQSAPDVRRSSGDDSDKQQTLPSIHEALRGEQPRNSYSSQPPYSAAPHSNYSATSAPSSPPPPRRAFGMDPPPPPHHPLSYSSRRSPGPPSQFRPEISPRTVQESQFERSRSGYNGAIPPPPPVHPSRNGYSPVHAAPPAPYSQTYPPAPSSPVKTERAPPAHSSTMPPPPPPPAPYSYGYTSNYNHRPAFAGAHPPPPPASSVYQPSVTQPAPAHPSSSRPGASSPEQNVHRESVKRHLHMYEFEAALNEIAESSSYMLDFSRHLGARMHQAQRSGPAPGTLPTVVEIDDLMAKSRGTIESLGRMRDIVVAQQAAYFQQAQEQQFKSQDEFKRDSIHDESKLGGFAGAEAKKRRGRAAPPGRCHACQRAETPEWRRGPDGARTLCNACGLHYAKLTRKQGAQKAAVGGSNLRPKAGTSDQPDHED